jgi:hypothetical protein
MGGSKTSIAAFGSEQRKRLAVFAVIRDRRSAGKISAAVEILGLSRNRAANNSRKRRCSWLLFAVSREKQPGWLPAGGIAILAHQCDYVNSV